MVLFDKFSLPCIPANWWFYQESLSDSSLMLREEYFLDGTMHFPQEAKSNLVL